MQLCFLTLLALTLPIALVAETLPPPQKIVILLGAPASGKGTQAVRLAEELKLPHISTGDLFRANISQNTPLGQKAKSYIDAGKLVPDEVVIDMVFDRIKAPDAQQGYILDGFPRTIQQAETFGKNLTEKARLYVLNLDVADETIVQRALGRKRSDDTPEVVKERLKTYHEHTAPLLDYYKKKGLLQNINGEQAPDQVFADLKKALMQ